MVVGSGVDLCRGRVARVIGASGAEQRGKRIAAAARTTKTTAAAAPVTTTTTKSGQSPASATRPGAIRGGEDVLDHAHERFGIRVLEGEHLDRGAPGIDEI